jgi:hypothetical protein
LTTAPAAVAACTPIWWFDSKEVNPGKQDSIYPPPLAWLPQQQCTTELSLSNLTHSGDLRTLLCCC